jgi:hypothetical protein
MAIEQLNVSRETVFGFRCCPKCKQYQHASFFPNKTPAGEPKGLCKGCLQVSRLLRGMQKSKYEDEVVGRPGSGWLRRRAISLFDGAEHRSRRLGVSFTITVGWIQNRLRAGCCEITGIGFDMNRSLGPGRRSNFSPSLERVNPCLGYTPDNCRVVVWIYNAAKGAGLHGDVERLVDGVISHRRASGQEARSVCFRRHKRLVPLREKLKR